MVLKILEIFSIKEYLNIVESVQPEIFIIENVKALLSTSAGWFKNQILEKIQQLGYFVDYGVLTASDMEKFNKTQRKQK